MTCDECAAKDAAIRELARQLAERSEPSFKGLRDRVIPRTYGSGFDPSTCPCNPDRGGSGICGCIRGSQITC